MKKKKLILRLLPWIIFAAIVAALVLFVFIPMYTQKEDANKYEPTIKEDANLVIERDGEMVPYEGALVIENDQLKFEMDPTTTHFKVTDKSNQKEWLSNPVTTPDEAKKDPYARTYAQQYTLLSTLLVHSRSTGDEKAWSNYEFSIANGNYEIEVVMAKDADGNDTDQVAEIRVTYAIGKIEKKYMIPNAWTKERYDEFTGKMKGKAKKQTTSNYTKQGPATIAKMNDSDENRKKRDELLAQYPALETTELYILKDVKPEMKASIEGYLAEVGYTEEEYAIDQQWLASQKEDKSDLFNVTVIYRLEGDDLVVEVPYDQIRFRSDEGNATVTAITLLPVFGAAGLEDEGYLLVPEGGGGIINFNSIKVSSDNYFGNIYGWDYSVERKEFINETRATFPVFGVSNQDASFICMMEGVNSFGSVYAETSKYNSSYNVVRAKYHVLHCGQYNVSAKTADQVFMFEKEIPEGSVIHRYRFLDSGNYVDMASAYGDYLREDEMLAQAKSSEDVPVSVELIGAIDKTVVKMGLPIESVVATTTFSQAQDIMLKLKEDGVKNLNIRMSGWANEGITQQVFTSVNILKELGGEKEMKAMIATAKDNGINLYFDGISCFAYDSGIMEGFTPFNDAARYATREQVIIEPYDVIYYKPAEWLDPFYLVQPQYAQKCSTNLINALKDVDAAGVAFRDIGNLLSGDLNSRNLVTREKVKAMNIQTLKEAKDAGQRVMIKIGNDYALPYTDIITDMDLIGTPYTIIDQHVPFYQIALHGMKDYTGEPINLAGDYMDEFLRCVEYGSGLNFTFMSESTWVLQDTTHSGLFGASFTDWEERAVAMICDYQSNMQGLNQQRIVSHQELVDNVTVTGYEDGTLVYVNYTDEDFTVDGVTVPARNYIVERGQ